MKICKALFEYGATFSAQQCALHSRSMCTALSLLDFGMQESTHLQALHNMVVHMRNRVHDIVAHCALQSRRKSVRYIVAPCKCKSVHICKALHNMALHTRRNSGHDTIAHCALHRRRKSVRHIVAATNYTTTFTTPCELRGATIECVLMHSSI